MDGGLAIGTRVSSQGLWMQLLHAKKKMGRRRRKQLPSVQGYFRLSHCLKNNRECQGGGLLRLDWRAHFFLKWRLRSLLYTWGFFLSFFNNPASCLRHSCCSHWSGGQVFALSGPEKDDPASLQQLSPSPPPEGQHRAPSFSYSGQFTSVEMFTEHVHSTSFCLASRLFLLYATQLGRVSNSNLLCGQNAKRG